MVPFACYVAVLECYKSTRLYYHYTLLFFSQSYFRSVLPAQNKLVNKTMTLLHGRCQVKGKDVVFMESFQMVHNNEQPRSLFPIGVIIFMYLLM